MERVSSFPPTSQLQKTAEVILEYLWEEEMGDYKDSYCPEGHIFEHMVKLDQLVYGHELPPSHFVEGGSNSD
jgi:hypothetical protein